VEQLGLRDPLVRAGGRKILRDLDLGLRDRSGPGSRAPGVEAVLDELGEGLARIRLAERQPADQLERIVDPELALLHPRGGARRARGRPIGSFAHLSEC